jgi:hypothetical protein
MLGAMFYSAVNDRSNDVSNDSSKACRSWHEKKGINIELFHCLWVALLAIAESSLQPVCELEMIETATMQISASSAIVNIALTRRWKTRSQDSECKST